MLDGLKAKIAKMGLWDMAFLKAAVFFFTIILVKLFPVLTDLGYPVLIAATVLCALKPAWACWGK